MEILSLLSFGNFIGFLLISVFAVKRNLVRSRLNLYAFCVCGSLGFWNFCNTFFYIAKDAETAMSVLRLAQIGMYAFPVFSLKFFFILTKRKSIKVLSLKNVLYYLPPIGFLLYSNLSGKTVFADRLTESPYGLGWVYVNSPYKVWFWLTFAYLLVYMGISLFSLYRFGKKSRFQNEKKQAKLLFFADSIVLAAGTVTDFILPLTGTWIPPVANIFCIIFLVFFYFITRELDMFNIYHMASSEIIFDTLIDPVMVLDTEERIQKVNTGFLLLFSFESRDLIGKTPWEAFQKWGVAMESHNGEFHFDDPQNGTVYITYSKKRVYDKMNGFMGLVIHLKDISEIKKKETLLIELNQKYAQSAANLERRVNTDALTNLPNRRKFFQILDDTTENQPEKDFAIIYMDLNGFKKINDTFGHEEGDWVLTETAKRLHEITQKQDLTARIGGDEFVMLMFFQRKEDAVEKCLEIKNIIAEPFRNNGNIHHLSMATGMSFFSDSGFNIDKMLGKADFAMYSDKRIYR